MKLYWLENLSFCPFDNGLLEKEGTVTLEVLKCKNCSGRYVHVTGQTISGTITSISDGFTAPKEICRPKNTKTVKAALILTMTVPTGLQSWQ